MHLVNAKRPILHASGILSWAGAANDAINRSDHATSLEAWPSPKMSEVTCNVRAACLQRARCRLASHLRMHACKHHMPSTEWTAYHACSPDEHPWHASGGRGALPRGAPSYTDRDSIHHLWTGAEVRITWTAVTLRTACAYLRMACRLRHADCVATAALRRRATLHRTAAPRKMRCRAHRCNRIRFMQAA